MDGIQPEAVDAEPGQVVQSAREPGEITDTVAVGVLERLDVQAVDDCLLIPALGHVAPLSPWQRLQNAPLIWPPLTGRGPSSSGRRARRTIQAVLVPPWIRTPAQPRSWR